MIRVTDLHKYYGEEQLFKGIDLAIEKGEAAVFIGPSGSGKSSLLRCINGLESFQQGQIIVDNIALHPTNKTGSGRTEPDTIRSIRLKAGMVFQHFNLFPHMTVLQNITEAPVTVLGITKQEAAENALALLKRINLNHKTGSYPAELSGGEQQRVAIARALAMKPAVMLFDEPTSSLDPETVGEVLSVIKDLVNEGMTTLIATHEMNFAREVADRIIVFDKGEIVEAGPPEQIFTAPRTERTRNFLSRVIRK